MVIPTQAFWRGTKRRKSKRAANGKPGSTKRQKRLRTGEDPTQSVASDADTPRSNDSNSVVGDLGSIYLPSPGGWTASGAVRGLVYTVVVAPL